MTNQNKDKKEDLKRKKTLLIAFSIIAVIALVFLGYSIFKPKTNLESSGKNISSTDLAQFPKTLTNFDFGEYLKNTNDAIDGNPHFNHKYATTTNGVKYSAICTAFRKETPSVGATCKLSETSQWDNATSAAIGSIVAHSYVTGGINGAIADADKDKYYIGEIAVNRYLCLLNNNNDATLCGRKNDTAIQSMDYDLLPASQKTMVDTLVNVGKIARAKATSELKVSFSPSTLTFTKSGDNWVSNTITVNGDYIDSWDVTLSNSKATVTKDGKTFKVTVPASLVSSGSSLAIKATVKATRSYSIAAKYDCGSGYQTITPSFTVKKVATKDASINGTIGAAQITIVKKDSSTGKNLKGAKLVLTKPDGSTINITTTDSPTVIAENLSYGKYTLKEVSAPDGYKLNSKVVTEELSSTKLSLTLEMENDPTGVTISKTASDIEGQLPGAELQILDKDGNPVGKSWTTTTNKKTIKGLAAGTYYLKEISAPAGYKKNSVNIEFVLGTDGSVKINDKTVSEVNMINYPIEATFSKTDIVNSEELKGAQLQILDKNGKEIKDSNGNVLYKWISTDKPHVISKIPAGTYFLVETQEPAGYVKRTEKIGFEIKEDGTITVGGKKVDKVVMTNEKTKVYISKQDVTNGKEIPGAELQITDASGEVIKKWTSTDKPYLIEGLAVGKYYLTEKIAPKGYVVSEEKIEFTIKNNGKVETYIMLNTPIVDVPNTASAASIIASIIGVIAVIFGGWMIFNNVKTKKA